MANFRLEDYEPVEERIKKFYKDYPEGRIITQIHFDDGQRIVVKASLLKDNGDTVWTTGFAEEIRGEGFVNKTSALENCETSAIGRALANANYAGSKRPSREEMTKVVERGPVETTNATPAAPEPATDAQQRKIFAMFHELKILDQVNQKKALYRLTEKESTKDLTKAEASNLIKSLEGMREE